MNFLDALNRSRIRFRRSGGSTNDAYLCCPFCRSTRGVPDTEFRLSVNILTGAGHCWHAGCGFKSRHAVFAILKELHVDGAFQIEGEEQEPVQQEPIRLPADFQMLNHASDDLDRIALNYLLNRGVTRMQIESNHVGVSYCGRYRYRIVFPVEEGKSLRGIVARDFTGEQTPKYLNSPGDKYMWGFQPDVDTVVLVEGIIKAMRIRTATGQHTAALLGHALVPAQRKQLESSKCQHVVLWPDPDRVGRQGVCKIADDLIGSWPGKVSVVWPVSKPADDMTIPELQSAWELVVPYGWGIDQMICLDTGR